MESDLPKVISSCRTSLQGWLSDSNLFNLKNLAENLDIGSSLGVNLSEFILGCSRKSVFYRRLLCFSIWSALLPQVIGTYVLYEKLFRYLESKGITYNLPKPGVRSSSEMNNIYIYNEVMLRLKQRFLTSLSFCSTHLKMTTLSNPSKGHNRMEK